MVLTIFFYSKVAIDAMAVDESVVPMDLEEATKMISAAGDR